MSASLRAYFYPASARTLEFVPFERFAGAGVGGGVGMTAGLNLRGTEVRQIDYWGAPETSADAWRRVSYIFVALGAAQSGFLRPATGKRLIKDESL